MTCNVYVIGSELGNDGVKIGISSDVHVRLKQLQTANSSKLKIWHNVPFQTRHKAKLIEKKLHTILHQWNKEGEWFDISPDHAIQKIDEIVNPEKYRKLEQQEKYEKLEKLKKECDIINKHLSQYESYLRLLKESYDFCSHNYRKNLLHLMDVKDKIKQLS